jgi:uncharacterized protein YndB with AHSA1/START domain
MQIDIDRYLGAVTREVASRDYEGRPARVVILSRRYPTTVMDLWDALTSAERIPRWFLPVSGDLRLGGRYQFEGNAGGEITACDPPRLLAATWEFGGGVSWLTVRLAEEKGGGARLELEHIAHVEGDFWDQFGPGAVGVGWDLALIGLGLHLATGAAVDPTESAAWSASEEGKAFARGSSEGWRRASIAAGTDEATATAAAARTTAFYTGEA